NVSPEPRRSSVAKPRRSSVAKPRRSSVANLETPAVSANPKVPIKVMLDSGAFSSWTKQQPIAVEDYIAFVREVDPYLWTYINLDCIPGARGRPGTMEDAEAAAAASFRNLKTMQAAGLKPLPVFHQGEDIKWLEQMLEDGQDSVGLSTGKNQRRSEQREWL